MGKKLTLDEVRDIFISRGYTPLFEEYNNSEEKLLAITKEGYKIYSSLYNIRGGKSPYIVDKRNPYSIENIKLWLKINNIHYDLLSKEYEKNDKKLKMNCEKHGEFKITWSSLQSKQGCVNCGVEKSSSLRKMTLEEVKNEFIHKGYVPLFEEYKNNNTKLLAKTKEGYKITIAYKNLKRGDIPSFFGNGNPYTIENIKLWMKINNSPYDLLSLEYKHTHHRLLFNCKKHGIFKLPWSHLQNGNGCAKCGIENLILANKINIGDVKNEFIKRGLKPLFKEYKGSSENLLAETKEGYKIFVSLNNLKRGYNHRIVHKNNPYTIENIHLWLKLNGSPYTLLSKKYIKSDEKLKMYCKDHGEFEIRWDALKQGTGCAECNRSKGEQIISAWLKNTDIKYIPQKEFDGLLGLGGKNLSYDFYLPKNNLLIEYQGEFHDGNGGGYVKQQYKKQKVHDGRKRNFAKINNINLLEIWYYDFHRIEEILEEYLFNYSKNIKSI